MTRFNSPLLLAMFVLVSCAGVVTSPGDSNSLDIVSRADWGWIGVDRRFPEHAIDRITIHHGGTTFADDRDTGEYLRSLQKWSREDKGWMDVPYHFVIDLQGRIYEGRPIQFPGDTNTTYDPRGHALIVVVGNYDIRELTERQFESLARLTALLARKYSVVLGDIKSHKDYAPGETACPGANIYQYLQDGSLLRRVEQFTGL